MPPAANAAMTPPRRRSKSARVAVAVAPPAIDDDDVDGKSIDELRRANAALEEEVGSPREVARSPSLLERLAADARDVFVAHVLPRLDDGDLAVLATVNRKMRDVVFESPVGDVRDVAAVRRELARVPNFVGSIARLAWAKERGCPWDEETFTCIAEGGNVEVAKWAKERGCPWDDEWTCTEAARGGHLEMVQWARANGAPWKRERLADAAEAATWRCCSGRARTDCPWDERLAPTPRVGGHLEVLQWARANGAPWDESTCAVAAYGGHLEVLQWARANGAPWDEWTCAEAADGGHLEVLQWARANGAPWDER